MSGEVEDESAYYSRDNFNIHSLEQLQLAQAGEVSHMTQTIEEQNLKLLLLNNEIDSLKGILAVRCMYVCMYVFKNIHACMYVCVSICVYMYECICICYSL